MEQLTIEANGGSGGSGTTGVVLPDGSQYPNGLGGGGGGGGLIHLISPDNVTQAPGFPATLSVAGGTPGQDGPGQNGRTPVNGGGGGGSFGVGGNGGGADGSVSGEAGSGSDGAVVLTTTADPENLLF